MSDPPQQQAPPPQQEASPEILEALERAQGWAASLGRDATQEEWDNQFQVFLQEEERKKIENMVRLEAIREKRKEAERRAAQLKKLKSTPLGPSSAPLEEMETETVSVAPPPMQPAQSRNDPTDAPEKKAVKRTVEKVIDPDSGKDAPDPKRSNIPLDKTIKRLCLKSIFEAFGWLLNEAHRVIGDNECLHNLNVSNALASIIFKTHNILRQRQNKNVPTNMQVKSSATDFPISFKGKAYTISRVEAERNWLKILLHNGLQYNVDKDSKDNWIGTMGPYLNMLGCWGLRLQ